MGLGLGFLRDLIELKNSGALESAKRVAEIGDQQLADNLITAPILADAYRLFGCASPPRLAAVGERNFTAMAPSSESFWTALGMERTAFDLTDGAVRLDLNVDEVPRSMHGAFDLVINTGTTEHVANQKNAFAVIHDLCRVGGVMYHELPAGGAIDHGLISYQPKFFHRLANCNHYEQLFVRYFVENQSPVPTYLRSGNHEGAHVVDCTLRVALRKRHDHRFVCPLDGSEQVVAANVVSTLRSRARGLQQRFNVVLQRVHWR
jgi:hypothetical protein